MKIDRTMTSKALFAAAEQAALDRLRGGSGILVSPAAKASDDEAEVFLYDAIGGWFGIAAKDFVAQLRGITAKTIHLRINSPGGDVFDAEAIQTAISQHPARVVAHIDGIAASAATYVALAADEVEMSDGAMFMIHNAWAWTAGNADDLLHLASILEKVDSNIVADYARKTGQPEDVIREWMRAETFFSADEALEHGFVDRIYTPPTTEKEAEEPAEATHARDASADRMRALALAECGI